MTSHRMAEHFENLPPEFRKCEKPLFVCWGFNNPRNNFERGYSKKAPINVKTGLPASPTNPDTWAPLETCIQAVADGKYMGVGIVLSVLPSFSLGLVGIDGDHCVNSQGDLTGFGLQVLQAGSYCEYSPSRTGIRSFIFGEIPSSIKTSAGELYSHSRFLRLTGFRFSQSKSIVRNDAALDGLWGALNAGRKNKACPPAVITGQSSGFYRPPNPETLGRLYQKLIKPHPSLLQHFHRPRGNPSVNDFAFACELVRRYDFRPGNPKHIQLLQALLFLYRAYHDGLADSATDQNRQSKKTRTDYLSRTIAAAFGQFQITKAG
jgi:hypothetical protein